MPQTIWKFPLPIGESDVADVKMPVRSEVLCVQVQDGAGGLDQLLGIAQPQLWALVDPDPSVKKETRRFRWIGTGHPADGVTADRYVGTIQMMGGGLIFHLFEVTRP